MRILTSFSDARLRRTYTFNKTLVCHAVTLLAAYAFASTPTLAQTNAIGTTPPSLAPGAPAGSYQLSGFESVNLYNGNLNFNLPLFKPGGRGGVGMTSALKIDSVKWAVEDNGGGDAESGVGRVGNYASIFGGGGGGGSTYTVRDNLWGGLEPGYGPGVLTGRGLFRRAVAGTQQITGSLTRLTFTTSSGTEYELRDQLTNGSPYGSGLTPAQRTRGVSFATADGTSARFLSDAPITDLLMQDEYHSPSGFLMLTDGTRYRIDVGLVTWMRDRHGNRLDFQYNAQKKIERITDALGRYLTFTYASGGVGCDIISFAGFSGTPVREIKIYRARLSSVLAARPGYAIKTYGQLFPGIAGVSTDSYDPVNIVSAVELPDNRRYQFHYNPYNELVRIDLPTGGAIEYDYTPGPGVYDALIHRRVTARRFYPDGGTSWTNQQTYGFVASGFDESPRYTDITVETRDAGGTLFDKSVHKFYGSPLAREPVWPGNLYPAWKDAREHTTEIYDADGTTLLKRVRQDFVQRASVNWWSGTSEQSPPNDTRPSWTETTMMDVNLVARQAFGYDDFNNQTDLWEYDYGIGAAPAYPVRHTHTGYLGVNPANGINYAGPANGANFTANDPHLLNLPNSQQIFSINPATGAETLVAQSETKYDETNFPVLSYASVTQWAAPETQARGNATTYRSWLNTTGGWLETHAQYDQCGNVRKSWGARDTLLQNPSLIDYDDAFVNLPVGGLSAPTYALATRSTSPIPDPTGQRGSQIPFVATSVYDYSTGLPTSMTDTNGQITNLSYADDFGNVDPLDRLRKIVRPGDTQLGGGGHTTYFYGDSPGNLFVETKTTFDATRSTDSYQYFDGMGRSFRSLQYENQDAAKPWLTVDTEYDALGRVKKQSLPYRSARSTANVFSGTKWTENTYDALGRVLAVITRPDNAMVVTGYSGDRVLVKDQAGRERVSRTDALGRLTDVWEVLAADASTETISFAGHPEAAAGYRTRYAYDALDNCRKVAQGLQTRYFMYDSLSRLIRARNPEQMVNAGLSIADTFTAPGDGAPNSQWTLADNFNANGDLITRTDARGVTTTYAYDNLSRNTTITYAGETPTVTANVGRYYDNPAPGANGLGRLWKSVAGSLQTFVGGYDVAGRPLSQSQQFAAGGVSYSVSRQYGLAGQVTSQTYPSGHTVTYQYDAASRVNNFTGNLGDGAQRVYSSGLSYDETGGMKQERFGSIVPVYNKRLYNERGQLSEVRVGTTSGDAGWNRGAILNSYSLNPITSQGSSPTSSGPDNNDNLYKQSVFIPNADQAGYEQPGNYSLTTFIYDYDALNRLDKVREERGGATSWVQDYDYDRYGNRTINQLNTTAATGINKKLFSVDAATNRLAVPAGQQGVMSYDSAGNLTSDTYTDSGSGTRTYDAENRMTSAQFLNGQTQTAAYTYDADGKRVKRNIGGQETWQIYGMGGDLLAEYAASAAAASPQTEYGYRNGELLVTADAPSSQVGPTVNLALGKSATQSSTSGTGDVARAVDGNTDGIWTHNSVTHTVHEAQPWWQVDLGAVQNLDHVRLWNRTDCCAERLANFYVFVSDTPFQSSSLSATISQAGVSSYYTANLTGPTLVQQVGRTGRYVRVQLTGTEFLSLAEAQVMGTVSASAGPRDVALAANGATVTASSTFNGTTTTFPASGVIDGDRKGANWEHDGGWNDNTFDNGGNNSSAYPDWVEVAFSGTQTINEINVFTLQDNYPSPVEPTVGQTFTQFGVKDFEVQYWTGSAWAVVPGGSVSNNNLVWKKLTFASVSTSRIRVSVTKALAGYSRIVEVEAYTESTTTNNGVQWLVSDQLNTPRLVIDQSGSLSGVKRHDYLPFGEEIGAGTGGRTTVQGYIGSGNVRQKWIGKERDAETGLDYFGARYYGSTLGRFSSVDPIKLAVARLYDPQRINLYGYCRNNPLKYLDPDGQDLILANDTAKSQASANLDANLRASERANVRINGNKVELINAGAIDTATASPGYRGLAAIVGSSRVINYFGLKPGESATATAGNTVTYDGARGGATQYNDNGADVFVPVGAAPDVYAANRVDFIPFPEDLVFGHEAYGHGQCGRGQCAVDVENDLRKQQGLPLRSGQDHESLPGERTGNMGSTSQKVEVMASPDLIQTTNIPLGTTIVPKPSIPVPPPPPSKRPGQM